MNRDIPPIPITILRRVQITYVDIAITSRQCDSTGISITKLGRVQVAYVNIAISSRQRDNPPITRAEKRVV